MAKTILLADDSVTIQKVVELTFMDEDYEVVAVSDGQTALERLPEVAPDLVIADIHMPGADGYEVCRRTKASHPSIPVLLLVGTFEYFDEEKFTEVGADGHLKKPFDSQELLGQVESLIVRAGGVPAAGVPGAGLPAAGVPGSGVPASEMPTSEVPLREVAGPAAAGAPPADPFELDQPPAVDDLEPPPLTDEAFPSSAETAAVRLDAPSPQEAEGAAPEAEPAEPAPVELEAPTLESAEPEAAAPGPAEAAAPGPAEPEAAAPEPAEPTAEPDGSQPLSDEDVDRIARRVAELVGKEALREVAWEVVPDLAEVIIKERIRELESQVE